MSTPIPKDSNRIIRSKTDHFEFKVSENPRHNIWSHINKIKTVISSALWKTKRWLIHMFWCYFWVKAFVIIVTSLYLFYIQYFLISLWLHEQQTILQTRQINVNTLKSMVKIYRAQKWFGIDRNQNRNIWMMTSSIWQLICLAVVGGFGFIVQQNKNDLYRNRHFERYND